MIRLSEYYRGTSTGNRLIEPGVYADDDPRLYDALEIILRKGYAVRIGAPFQADEPAKVDAAPAREDEALDLEAMTVTELRDLANDLGIGLSSTTRKADIIKAIESV